MDFYHGSSVGGLTLLLPCLSEHGRAYVYFADNPVVAAFYTVRAVEAPYNWFPYGFAENGLPCYTEYYANALSDIYAGKSGYLYRCTRTPAMAPLPGIRGAYVSGEPSWVSEPLNIGDMAVWFYEREQEGLLRIERFETLTEKQRRAGEQLIAEEIARYGLRARPDASYSRFLAARFPSVWNASTQ